MTTVLNIKTNKAISDKAKKVFSSLGISTTDGVNLFLSRVATDKELPFSSKNLLKRNRAYWKKQIDEAMTRKGYKNAKEALRGL
jgi:addiction module RelB/DinJ family antitoxin